MIGAAVAVGAAGIPNYGGRSESAMADVFSRATGEVTATSGTEGPGFTSRPRKVSKNTANGL